MTRVIQHHSLGGGGGGRKGEGGLRKTGSQRGVRMCFERLEIEILSSTAGSGLERGLLCGLLGVDLRVGWVM